MKKLLVLCMVFLAVFSMAGCRKKEEPINYDAVVDIPSIIEVDIEDMPDRLERLIVVHDESKVIKVTVDTDEVNFTAPGDYSILIIVDYSDGTTRVYNSILRLALNEDIGVPRIIGVRNHLVDVGSDQLDLMDGVAFSDDQGIVDSGIHGEVDYTVEGLYNVTYYVEDTAGNYVTSSAFVLVGEVYDYYDDLLPTMYEATSEEKRYIREYSLLYSAVFRKANQDSFDSRFFDYLDNFFSANNYAELIGRKLRDDEITAINKYRDIVKKEDKMLYQAYYNKTMTNQEDDHFENTYLSLSRYTATITRKDYLDLFGSIEEMNQDFVQKDILQDVNDFDIIVNTTDELASEIVESLDFYRNYRMMRFNPHLLHVIKNTDYELDDRVHDLDYEQISDVVLAFSQDNVTPWKINSYIETERDSLTSNELLYLEILSQYTKYKLLYLFDLDTSSAQATEEFLQALDVLSTIGLHSGYQNSLLSVDFIHIEEIEAMLLRSITTSEENGMLLFFDLYLTKFRPTTLTAYMIMGEYFTSLELDKYRTSLALEIELESYSSEYQPFTFNQLDVHEMEHILQRELTIYEISAIEFSNQYQQLDSLNLDVIYQYDFTSRQLDLLAKYSLSNELKTLNNIIKLSTYENAVSYLNNFDNKVELLDMFNALRKVDYLSDINTYYPHINDEIEKQKIYTLVNTFLTRDITREMFTEFLTTNNDRFIEEEFTFQFTESDKEVLAEFIEAKKRLLDDDFDAREYVSQNYLYYECDLACIDSFEIAHDYMQIGYDEFHSNINQLEIYQIEERFGDFTPLVYDAFITIKEHIGDVKDFYRVLSYLHIRPESVNIDNFHHYKVVYDFMVEDNLTIYDFTNPDIVQILSRHRSLTTEEQAAAEYIENEISSTINHSVFSEYYDHGITLNMNIDIVKYVNVYTIYQQSSLRMSTFIAVIEIPNDVTMSFEDEVDFAYVEDQFDLISNTSDNLIISSSEYNILTLREISKGLEVLNGFGIDDVNLPYDEYTELYLDSDFTSFINSLSINNRRYVTEIIKVVIREQFKEELELVHPELFYQTSDVDDIMTNLFYELTITNTSYFWDTYNLELNLGRELTDAEEFLFEFVDFTEATELKIKEARNLGLLSDTKIPLLDLKGVFDELSNQDIAYLYSNISDFSPKVYVLRQFINRNFTNEDIDAIGELLNADALEIGSFISSIQSTEDLNQYTNEEIVQLVTRVNNLLPVTNINGSYFLNAGLGQYSFGFEYNLLRDNTDFINAVKASIIYMELAQNYPYNEYTTPKELIINSVYYVLDKPGEILSFSIQDFETIKPFEYFEYVFGRELTEFEQYIIHSHSIFVANNFIQTSIENYNKDAYQPLTLSEIETLYELRDLYILIQSQGVSIYDYANDINLQMTLGVLLNEDQIELIQILEEVNTN